MRSGPLPLRFAFAFALTAWPACIALGAGCNRSRDLPPDPGPSAPASPNSVAEALGLDADTVTTPVDPPPPAGDLRAELDAFTTLEACVTQHAALDPLVGDAIRAIGYETFLRDACRMLDAAKANDAKRCDAIDAGGLRHRCHAVVAMVSGEADACPWLVDDRRAQGREPTCVAVASRDPRLCAGELRAARATCEALAGRDEARCAGAIDKEQGVCRREALRWKRTLEAPATRLAPLTPPSAKLAIHGAEGTPDPAHPDADVTLDVAQGAAVYIDVRGVVRLDLGTRRELGSTVFVPSPGTHARFAATLRIEPATPAAIEHLELDVPGASTLVYPGVRCDCRVEIVKLERKRGGEIQVKIEGIAGVPPRAYDVRAEVTTFVRDVVDDAKAAGLPTLPVRKPR
jgi:hypothetical protein